MYATEKRPSEMPHIASVSNMTLIGIEDVTSVPLRRTPSSDIVPKRSDTHRNFVRCSIDSETKNQTPVKKKIV